jgi:hypothetical protein
LLPTSEEWAGPGCRPCLRDIVKYIMACFACGTWGEKGHLGLGLFSLRRIQGLWRPKGACWEPRGWLFWVLWLREEKCTLEYHGTMVRDVVTPGPQESSQWRMACCPCPCAFGRRSRCLWRCNKNIYFAVLHQASATRLVSDMAMTFVSERTQAFPCAALPGLWICSSLWLLRGVSHPHWTMYCVWFWKVGPFFVLFLLSPLALSRVFECSL